MMKTIKFKTNIKCGGCIAQVTPYLNEAAGVNKWDLDIESPQKTLTVSGETNEMQIKEAVRKAGFTAEKVG